MSMNIQEKAAYLAAFVDGEGHIGLHKTSQGYWIRSISVCNTEKNLIDFILGISIDLGFEPTLQFSKSRKENWADRWIVYIARSKAFFKLFKEKIPIKSPRKIAILQDILTSYANQTEVARRRRTGEDHKCETCGSLFYVCGAIKKRGGGRFCSIKCRGLAGRKTSIRKCAYCGREFAVKPAQKNVYCSITCFWNVPGNREKLAARSKGAAMKRWNR